MDWSGNATRAAQRRHIFVASWHGGVVTLEYGYTREEVCDLVRAAAEKSPELVLGLALGAADLPAAR